ncbi:exopolysaccharide biosynthesis polyprenyl glycosylphosphotransferase [Candidatus Giovannonibacteria bacterium]|nr:exopolysaccharide biosynthesis polyprenyl glycosylphosphotransferase [Candidatus Giovannonibacteria bacterium]
MIEALKKHSIVLIIGDVAVFALGLFLTLVIRYLKFPPTWERLNEHLLPFSFVFILWILIYYIAGLYSREIILRKSDLLATLIKAQISGGVVGALFFYLLPFFEISPRVNLFLNLFITFILVGLWRFFARYFFHPKKESILIIAAGPEVAEFSKEIEMHPSYSIAVAAKLRPEEFESQFSNNAASFMEFLKTNKISLVAADFSAILSPKGASLLYHSLEKNLRLTDFKELYENIFQKVPISLLKEDWFLKNITGRGKNSYLVLKRILDIVIALILLVPAAILSPFIFLAIFFASLGDIPSRRVKRARPGDGIIFFSQKRVGERGGVFDFIKFRSYSLGAEKMAHTKDVPNDSRNYAVGKLLRKLYLDELPQLLNVLKGEMSLVGPRPERPEYVEELKKKIPYYEMRLLIPPGITGWAQINMKNDASVEDAPEKILYDLYYMKNMSLWLDLRILLKTIAIVLSRSGK